MFELRALKPTRRYLHSLYSHLQKAIEEWKRDSAGREGRLLSIVSRKKKKYEAVSSEPPDQNIARCPPKQWWLHPGDGRERVGGGGSWSWSGPGSNFYTHPSTGNTSFNPACTGLWIRLCSVSDLAIEAAEYRVHVALIITGTIWSIYTLWCLITINPAAWADGRNTDIQVLLHPKRLQTETCRSSSTAVFDVHFF